MGDEITKAPAEVAPTEQPNGATPSPVDKEQAARAALRGEVPAAVHDPEDINNQFDPETGELLDEDPNAPAEAAVDEQVHDEPVETEEQKADREEAEEAAREAEAKKKGEPKRIRVNRDNLSDRDFAIVRLADDQKISFAEAEKRLFGDSKPAEATAADAQATTTSVESRIAQVKTALEAAAETMDTKAMLKLGEELGELKDQLKDLKSAENSRQQSEKQTKLEKFSTAEKGSINRAIELYPDANRDGSALHKALNEKKEDLLKSDPEFFANPRWPLLLITDVASELGIGAAPKGGTKPPPPAAPPLVVPKKPTRPIVPAEGTATSAASSNPEVALAAELKAATASRDVNAIKAVMRKIDAARKK